MEELLDMNKVQKSGYKRRVILCGLALASSMTLTLAATPHMTSNDGAPQIGAHIGAAASSSRIALVEAAKAGNVAKVRRLVADGANVNDGIDGDGTALIAASKAGHLNVVNALLKMGAQPNVCWAGDGTALIAAVAQGHRSIASHLVTTGAQLNLICDMDETALIAASRNNQTKVAIFLVSQGADVNLGVMGDSNRWRTPLNQARNPELRAYLIAHGATEDGDGHSKLH